MSPRGRRRTGVTAVLLGALVLTACSTEPVLPPPAPPTPDDSATPRQFATVGTTDVYRQLDPAGVTDAASTGVVNEVFQRLVAMPPGVVDPAEVPRPALDAASECIFTSDTVFSCTLAEDMTFHNGEELTSSDVKFSIDRALRLDVPGSSVSLLSSLQRIDTPDPLTVRFVLSQPDTQFPFALAGPAAAIVDEDLYDPDQLRDPDEEVVGSGPYQVSDQTEEVLRFDRFTDFVGPRPGVLDTVLVRSFEDSASLEQAMTDDEVDLVYRGLSEASVTRLRDAVELSPEGRTDSGFTLSSLPGARVHRLHWADDSGSRGEVDLRNAVSAALQSDRTLDSIVPPTSYGYLSSFAVGGLPTPTELDERFNLVLSYDSRSPDGVDLANVVRTRVEAGGGVSVRVAADADEADLFLLDEKPWTSTPLAWLQRYLDDPALGSSVRVEELLDRYQAGTETPQEAEALLGELQKQAAADAVLLPVDQSDEPVFVGPGIAVDLATFGPGGQLGLRGISRG